MTKLYRGAGWRKMPRKGASLTEYVVLSSLVGIVALWVVLGLGWDVGRMFGLLGDRMGGVPT